jgi:K+ transporter
LATALYGIAVCGNMAITTILTFYVIRYAWKILLALCVAATVHIYRMDIVSPVVQHAWVCGSMWLVPGTGLQALCLP